MDFHEYQTRVKTTLDHRTTKPGSLFTNYIKSLVIDNILHCHRTLHIYFKSHATL